MIRVLTIDGGGVRGIIPAAILAYLETKIQQISKKPNARIVDYIDFIAGTSTGSLTAAAMLIPNEKLRPKYSLNNIVDFYISFAPSMYKIPLRYKIKTLGGLLGPLIPDENREKTFLHIFDHYKMKELLKSVLFPAYDINKRSVVLYTNNDPMHKYGDFFVKDVVKGTTAIPYISKPGYFRNGVDVHTVIDGGLIAPNPAMIAMFEVFKQGTFPPDLLFISIGTGIAKHTYRYTFNESKSWGRVKWFFPLIDIVKSANNEIISYQLEKVFDIREHPENYIRLNPSIQYSSKNPFDCSELNIRKILQDAEEYIKENQEMLDNLAQRLYDCK